jgi:hypothetical protein
MSDATAAARPETEDTAGKAACKINLRMNGSDRSS